MAKRPSNRKCCIVDCENTPCKHPELQFYRFPGRSYELERKQKWVTAIRRQGIDGKPWQPGANSRICSAHFVGGEKSNNPLKEAYNPTIFPSIHKKKRNVHAGIRTEERISPSVVDIAPMEVDSKSTTTCQSVTSTPSMDSNIVQNDFELVLKEENTIAEKLLSIKEESELYCRICLCVTTDSNSYINIFPSYGENSCRQDKIQEMIREIMPDLDLSLTYNPGICTDCESRLISAYDFVSLSIQNQKSLIDYKCKYGDNVYVNIQDVVKTCDNTLNKRQLTDLTDVPSKKLKTLIPSNDQLEIKSDIQHQDITVKEELDWENSNDFIESTEVKNNEAITEQSCNRLLNRSADKDNYCNLKYINVSVPSLKQTTTSLSEKSGEEKNTSDEVQTYIKKLAELKSNKPVNIIYGNRRDLNNTKFEGTKINTIQTNKSDTSKS